MTQRPGQDEALIALVAAGDAARADRATRKWAALTDRERALVREAAVMGYVHGTMVPAGARVPRDAVIVQTVLLACDSHDDLYPTIAALGDT